MAQERKKRRIVLASLLKPVDDTRMFEKMGRTLSEAGYEVIIIGYPSNQPPHDGSIQFVPLNHFNRLSIQRWKARVKVLLKILQCKPDLLLINTHELLPAAVFYKLLFWKPVIYDVRENYCRNITLSGSFRSWLRYPLGYLVRFKETVLAPFINHFLLAEKAYAREFSFHGGRYTVVENKAVSGPKASPYSGKELNLLFSGTLDESTGVFKAIEIASRLNELDSQVTLTIIGYAALKNTQRKLADAADSLSFIRLVGITSLVPHYQILKAIETSHAGFITYLPSPHSDQSYPTKLYEYMAARLPIILDRRWPWVRDFEKYQPFASTSVHEDYPSLLHALKEGQYYTSVPTGILWSDEAPAFLQVIARYTA